MIVGSVANWSIWNLANEQTMKKRGTAQPANEQLLNPNSAIDSCKKLGQAPRRNV